MNLFTRLTKKGQVAGIQSGFQALILAMIFLGVVVITLAFVGDMLENKQDGAGVKECATHTGYTSYNTTSNLCYNASGTEAAAGATFNVTQDGLTATNTFAEGTEDVSDVSVITIILSLLFGVLAIFGVGYMRR